MSRTRKFALHALLFLLLDDTDLKGIYVFNVESVEATKASIESDLTIKVGRLIMELHPWHGSAALQKVPEIHGTIQRERI